MGATIDTSPKYHPEIAGGGIECDWGLLKLHYQRNPLLKHERNKKNPQSCQGINKSKHSINIQFVWSCSKKARAYIHMKLYKIMENVTKRDNQEEKQTKSYVLNKQ